MTMIKTKLPLKFYLTVILAKLSHKPFTNSTISHCTQDYHRTAQIARIPQTY